MSVFDSTMQAGRNLQLSSPEMLALEYHAKQYRRWIKQLRSAQAAGNKKKVQRIVRKLLTAFSPKVCAVARTARLQDAELPTTLFYLEERAARLNPFRAVPEPVVLRFRPKHDAGSRPIFSFGWRRRAPAQICFDILDQLLPKYAFDYLDKGKGGVDEAVLRLRRLIDSGSYHFVVVVDIKNCFGSVDKERVAKLLPLPATVVRHVLLLGDEAKVVVKPPKGDTGTTPGSPGMEADEAARRGLPQGCSTSGMIVRRAVLGPMLAALPFADRLVLFQDEVAVVVKDMAEAEVVLGTLRSMLSAGPGGPLPIGRCQVRHVEQGFDFLGYYTRRKPVVWGGELHSHPSARAYRKAEAMAAQRYSKAGQGWAGVMAVGRYFGRWRASFRLWKPNRLSRIYQWLEFLASPLPRPSSEIWDGTSPSTGEAPQ
jgi:hypothetical protein